jgi:hypothetical protein
MIHLSFFIAVSAERPPSACSIRYGTRQRLQKPSTRRIYAIDDGNNISALDSNISLASLEAGSTNEDNQVTSNTQQDVPMTTPLRHLILKKSNPGRVEVRRYYFQLLIIYLI